MPNVFYEEEGEFKVGAVLAEQPASLQVEAPHGKRTKVKAAHVLVRFDAPPLGRFMAEAQKLAEEIDVDFLWQCCGEPEFSYETLAREYYGHAPSALEGAAVLMRLHGAPMYFYRKGRGCYKAAPEDALKAALASIERKRRQAEEKSRYVTELAAQRLPEAFRPIIDELLYAPDKMSLEWKALDEACTQLKVTPAHLLARCGALPSSHDYHFRRFLFEHFPRGTDFGPLPAAAEPEDLPLAEAAAFSIDDAATTEIDDAFSVTPLPAGGWRIGVHIAAPALGIAPDSEIDQAARDRLSTVYFPGGKITMLPEAVIERFTLAEGRVCAALSFYLDIAPDYSIAAEATRIERVKITANLRHDTLEPLFNERTVVNAAIEHDHGRELRVLFEVASRLEQARRGPEPEPEGRPEFSFRVEGDRVAIVRRHRGTPIDKVVSELMIHVNSAWGRALAKKGLAAIFRVQSNSKVRMSSVPGEHAGLGVAQYLWASSPLRRYVDLVNQRQIAALARGEAPPYRAGDDRLLAAMRDFEAAYEAYADVQRTMERYWCLRWLTQENRTAVTGVVIRESLVRLDDLPLVVRVPSLPVLAAGATVELGVSDIDLLDLTLQCEFRRQVDEAAVAATGG